MPKHQTKISGTVTHIFAHRFVVQTGTESILADLTPPGRDKVGLQIDDRVVIEGEQKPSELKVAKLAVNGGHTVVIDPHDKNEQHPYAEPGIALRAAQDAGFETLGTPRRKPKHFEVLGQRQGRLSELHIELDGHIRKVKNDVDREKWAEAIPAV